MGYGCRRTFGCGAGDLELSHARYLKTYFQIFEIRVLINISISSTNFQIPLVTGVGIIIFIITSIKFLYKYY